MSDADRQRAHELDKNCVHVDRLRWPVPHNELCDKLTALFEADAARIATLEARIAELTRERDEARDEVDAVGSVVKEAADWVRRLAEFAPLLHVADRQDGETEARAWLAAWDSVGAAIVAKRAAEYATARAERDEARFERDSYIRAHNELDEAAKAARAERDEAVGLLVRVDHDVDYATDDDPLHNGALEAVRAWRLARLAAPVPEKGTTP